MVCSQGRQAVGELLQGELTCIQGGQGACKHAELSLQLLEGAESLAMPALALGILVRHLEAAGTALDPYLIEPEVWELEFARIASERMGGLAARTPEIEHPERRSWSLGEVSMMLTLRAEGDRVRQPSQFSFK